MANQEPSPIVSVNPDRAEFETDDARREPSRLDLLITDSEGDMHRLVLLAPAIRELAELIRGLQTRFPGVLGAH